MELTNAQRTTLRNAVLADPVLSALTPSADNADAIATAMNAATNPAFFVWKSTIQSTELFDAITWPGVDNLTVGRARIFEWMILAGTIKPELQTTRTGITQCFGAATATEVAIFALFKRVASRVEALLANTTSGDGQEATPARLRVEGQLSYQDVIAAMQWTFASARA